MPSNHEGTESVHISGVTGGSQKLTVLEAKISLTGKDWQKHPIVTALRWLRVKKQQVLIATKMVHRQQCHTNRDSMLSIHKLIHQLESQGVISKTHSPFNSPIWPVRKASGEWRLTVDYRGLNEVTPPLSAAVPNMLELQ